MTLEYSSACKLFKDVGNFNICVLEASSATVKFIYTDTAHMVICIAFWQEKVLLW